VFAVLLILFCCNITLSKYRWQKRDQNVKIKTQIKSIRLIKVVPVDAKSRTTDSPLNNSSTVSCLRNELLLLDEVDSAVWAVCVGLSLPSEISTDLDLNISPNTTSKSCACMTQSSTVLGKKFKNFSRPSQGLSTTFSRPIAVIFYHIMLNVSGII